MNTITKRGKDLKPGDKVIEDATGKTLTIQSLSPGMIRSTRLVQYKGEAEWSTLGDNHWYIVAGGPKKGTK